MVHTKLPQKTKTQQAKTTMTTKMHPPTTCHRDYTANQIGNHATHHSRKNNRKNNPKATNQTIWILCEPKLLYPPQLHQHTIRNANMVLLLTPFKPCIP